MKASRVVLRGGVYGGGPVPWNGLPLPIRQDKNIDSFKSLPRTYLFSRAFC